MYENRWEIRDSEPERGDEILKHAQVFDFKKPLKNYYNINILCGVLSHTADHSGV